MARDGKGPVIATPQPVQHFIDGRFVPGAAGRTFATLNPATNAPLAAVAEGLAEDVDRAVGAAHRAFTEGPWPRLPARQRAAALRRIAEGIERRIEQLAQVESLDTGLPIRQSRGQLARAADNFHFFAEMSTRLTGESLPLDGQFLNYTIRRPVGVAGLITPWNTPFMLATWKVAPCLAAGNTCVLKPAEWSPLSAHQLAEVVGEADLPPGVFNVVHGFGETAGAALVRHPLVRLISFTGETVTGQEIMRNGAATLKRLSLEMGGKSPVIVFADADCERAMDAAVFGAFSLNGERCTAGSRLLLEAPLYERLIAVLSERVRRLRVGDPFDEATEVGPLIHPDHWQRVRGYVEEGRREGATVAVGGRRPPGLTEGNYLEPTLLVGVDGSMRLAREEIFGPVLVAMAFADEAEAIRLANDVPYGLAAYVWTQNLPRAHRVAHALEAGMVWLNSQNVRDLRVPFGGMKQSGIGREGGHYSFDFYTEWQATHVALGEHPIPRMGATD